LSYAPFAAVRAGTRGEVEDDEDVAPGVVQEEECVTRRTKAYDPRSGQTVVRRERDCRCHHRRSAQRHELRWAPDRTAEEPSGMGWEAKREGTRSRTAAEANSMPGSPGGLVRHWSSRTAFGHRNGNPVLRTFAPRSPGRYRMLRPRVR